jgi:hypothetical protein
VYLPLDLQEEDTPTLLLVVKRTNLRKCLDGKRHSANCQFGWLRGSRKLLTEKIFWLRGVDLNHRPLGYEDRGKLQIQLLCGADDNPRLRMNTVRFRYRDHYLTLIFNRVFNSVATRIQPRVSALNGLRFGSNVGIVIHPERFLVDARIVFRFPAFNACLAGLDQLKYVGLLTPR